MSIKNFVDILTDRTTKFNARPLSTVLMFLNNKQALKDAQDGTQDKRFHARANAQAGQIFDIPTALGLSLGREAWDILRKNTWNKQENLTPRDILNDSKRDIQADLYGLKQGLRHPFSNVDSILDYNYLDSLNH